MSHVALFLFGPPRIECDGEPVELDTRKAVALASYLAISGESHSRDALATLFWPLSDQSHARAALRRTLSTLRRALGQGKLEVDGERLALRPSADFWLDVDQFHHLLGECRTHGHLPEKVCPACLAPLSRAITLYRADFMTGFTLRDSPGFDEWQFFQTENLRLELAWALQRLVRCHFDTREFEPAIAYARRWVALDPIREQPHYILMQIYAWAGQRSAALRQYQEYVEVLEREMGAPPAEDISQLYQAIRENKAPPLPSRTAPVPSHNLPLQPTPFIGREEELLEIGQLLDRASCRLLTLSGPGGIGKTRLALEAAAQRTRAFSHGVYFVPLAHLSSTDLLVPAIAESLRFSFHGGADPKAQLLNYLREKEMLLLLDNFEHLLDGDGTDLLVDILSSVPRVKLLVTSRERLNLQWEWPFEVRGLRFPQDDEAVAPEEYSAIRLFLQSARRAHAGFALSEAEKPFVVRICRSLEGMPLGIELAVAWVEVLSCQRIAQEIERNLNFLITSRRDVPERHRSLQAAFKHSWELLSADDRSVLSRLSVFRSGFRGEAAEHVAGASPMHLSALMHKSFLRRSPTGRYEMLEVLRQYAEDKLQQSSQTWNETHDRHCEYYVGFLHRREERLKGEKQQQALDEIVEEIDNVRAVWRWAVAHRMQAQIEKSAESLYRFYEMRSWFFEGEEVFGQAAHALEGAEEAEIDALLAQVRTRQGWFCLKLSRFEEGRELLGASLSALRRLAIPGETALALNHLGFATAMLGDFDAAARLFQESITIFRAIGDPVGMASSLNNIGIVALMQRRHAEAKLLLRESLAIREDSGNLTGMVDSLTNLGLVAETLGEYDEAKRIHQKCLGICIEIDDRWGIANSLCNLAFSLCALGEDWAARRCFRESLQIAVDLQAVDLILEDLIGIATLQSEAGEKEQAVELVACALSHPAMSGKAKERAEQLLSSLESQLTPQTFVMAQDRGKAKDIQYFARVNAVGQPTF
jgi:predicted ATPase/DNA-binding SARP family transcriptional activator